MKNYVTKTSDSIVLSVIEDLDSRSSVGIKKYGTTLDENNTDDFLQHAIEEALDLVLYLRKLQKIRDETKR